MAGIRWAHNCTEGAWMPLQLYPLAALNDNYIWLAHDGRHAMVVDPGEADPVISFLQQQQLELGAILITHHHADHCHGVAELRRRWPQAQVLGPASVQVLVSQMVGEGDTIVLTAPAMELAVWAVPGHTLDHLAYYGHGWLFCGDTLFAGGCGRLFEGSAAQLYHSLQRLAALPATTLVCCAHEYTLANLAFAAAVEPDNAAIAARIQRDSLRRQQQLATLPATLADEWSTNPFLRCHLPQVAAAVAAVADEPVKVFTKLRIWKDKFRTT